MAVQAGSARKQPGDATTALQPINGGRQVLRGDRERTVGWGEQLYRVYSWGNKGRVHSARPHLLEHPLPLDRDLVRRAQELAHPLHHGAQLGGTRGRAVGLRVPQPRGDRLGLEGERVLWPRLLARVGHQRAQLLLRLGQPPLRQPQLDQGSVVGASDAVILPEPRHRLGQQRLGLRQLALRQEHLAEVAGAQNRVLVVVARDLAPRRQRLAEQRLRLGQLALPPQAERQVGERRQHVRGPVPTPQPNPAPALGSLSVSGAAQAEAGAGIAGELAASAAR
eukprot:scaffold8134_cov57-Phaeocystis_antarctica.AAC.2